MTISPFAPIGWRGTADQWVEHQRAIIATAQRTREHRATVARDDPDTFCRFVLRDERTSVRITQAPMHKEWQKLLSTHSRLILWSHVEGGKSTQIALGRVLWELGRNPNLRVCVVSNTSDLAKKLTRQLGQYIEKSPELHEVFPNLRPTTDPNLPWRAQALTVEREGLGARDPSVQACGVHGNIIGSRVDLFVFDDILDYENTNTPGPREDTYRWVKSISGRLTEGGRIWMVGNAWHPDDPMHRMEREEHFHAIRFPVRDAGGALTWPERWSGERIEVARKDLGPLEYARQLLCQARDDTSSRFKREWVDGCVKAGAQLTTISALEELYDPLHDELPEGFSSWDELAAAQETTWRLTGKCAVFTGVDLAVQRKDSSDETALFTIHVDAHGNRRVLEVLAGKWTGPEIIDRLADVHKRFGGIMVVENNAAQDYIVQFARHSTAIPVFPFTTGRNKAHPEFGIEGLAVEMSNTKWLIPSKGGLEREVGEWVKEVLYYDPKEHTGDRLMASWFAREGARRFADGVRGGGGVSVRTF